MTCENCKNYEPKSRHWTESLSKHFACNAVWLQKMLFTYDLRQLLISSVKGIGKTHSAFAWMMNRLNNSPDYDLQSVIHVSYNDNERISHIKRFKEIYWDDIKEPNHYATVTNNFILTNKVPYKEHSTPFVDIHSKHLPRFKSMYWGDTNESRYYTIMTNKERSVTFIDIRDEHFQNLMTDGILCNWIHFVFDDVPLEELRKFDVDLKKAGNILVIGSADRVPL